MNHRPFEDWLLEEQPLTVDQRHELQAHLRNCTSCTAIAESNLALHTTQMVPPKAGFAERFQVRLAQRRQAEKGRQMIGIVILVLGGLGLLSWLAAPLVQEALSSPAQWLTAVVGYFLFVLTSIQALREVGLILLRVIPNFVPPVDWLIAFLMTVGVGALWVVSIWRVARIPRGV